MKKQYKIQLPKGKKVTMTNVDFEDGVMTVNIELENRTNFHEAIHNEVCGVFGKINNEFKEVLKANGVTREKIEEMAKESIKELEKDCPDIWDKMIQEYGEAICGNKVQKYEPKDGDFVYVKAGYEHISIFKKEVGEGMYVHANSNMSLSVPNIIVFDSTPLCCIGDIKEIRPATEAEKKLLIEKLAEVGKRWNPNTKQIEDVRWRAKEGGEYYYVITTSYLVEQTFDRYSYIDDNLYKTDNYFKTREAAEKVAEQIRNIFKNSKSE